MMSVIPAMCGVHLDIYMMSVIPEMCGVHLDIYVCITIITSDNNLTFVHYVIKLLSFLGYW